MDTIANAHTALTSNPRRPIAKGEATREFILDAAVALAREVGLSGLSIGMLAERTGMSKSGLFAHFGAKEELQLAVLRAAQQRFDDAVARPAFLAPRGLPRLRGLFNGWLHWSSDQPGPGGCVLLAAASEFDDRPGVIRDFLCAQQEGWLTGLRRTIGFAMEAGELPQDTDTRQFAFEVFGLILSTHHHSRLLRDARYIDLAVAGLERLIAYPPRLAS